MGKKVPINCTSRSTPEEIAYARADNERHHKTFWLDTYKEKGYECANLYMEAERIITRLQELQRVCKNIDANRRENAVLMEVPIASSDLVYSFDDIFKAVPELVQKMKDAFGEMGVKI